MKRLKQALLALAFVGCAGFERDCSSCNASNFGSDWIVVQYRNDGTPINCWMLNETAISNEQSSDGIFWRSPSGHLVHISGWYNRVQVVNRDFKGAAKQLNVNYDSCTEGAYVVDAGRD